LLYAPDDRFQYLVIYTWKNLPGQSKYAALLFEEVLQQLRGPLPELLAGRAYPLPTERSGRRFPKNPHGRIIDDLRSASHHGTISPCRRRRTWPPFRWDAEEVWREPGT
jgi:hypothetical protein